MKKIFLLLLLLINLTYGDVVRYVNSASTSGGDGTTNLTSGPTRAYKHIQMAVDAAPITLNTIYEIVVTGMDTVSASALLISPHGATSTNYFYIHAASGTDYRHLGFYDQTKAGVYSTAGWGQVVDITCPYVKIDGMQISGVAGLTNMIRAEATVGSIEINACIMVGVPASKGVTVNGDATVLKVSNCLIYSGTNAFEVNNGNLYVYNTTMANMAAAVTYLWAYNRVFKNCLFYNNTSDVTGGTLADTYCATDKTSAGGLSVGGTGNIFSKTFSFTNAGTSDYHLLVGDVGAKAFGTNLTSDATYPVTTDIDGEARSAPFDIGMDQYSAGCNFPTITAVKYSYLIGDAGYYDHVIAGGTADSVKMIGTLPDSAYTNKTGANIGRVVYHWKVKTAKAGYAVKIFGCSNVQVYDTITVNGPSVSYPTSPKVCRIGDVVLQDPVSNAMADSFTVTTTLPAGLTLTKTGTNAGRISGVVTTITPKAAYKIYTWRKDIKADSTWDTISVLAAKVYDAKFWAYPGYSVKVGEEVIFSAESTTNVASDTVGTKWEWDFGDGYFLKYGHPVAGTSEYSGINTTHYFMTPGVFDVKLFYTRPNGDADTLTKSVTVTGLQPMTGFESWHAPFQSRTKQFIYTQIPASIVATPSDTLIIRIENNLGMNTVLRKKANLTKEDTLLLNNSSLPAASYIITSSIINAAKDTLTRYQDFFKKTYAGAPRYGIDEYNNFIYNGKPYFPVSTWFTSISELPQFKTFSNQVKAEGWYAIHDSLSWLTTVQGASSYSMTASGPFRYSFKGISTKNLRNGYMHDYLDKMLTNPLLLDTAMYMWGWEDEPNLGGRNERFPPSVLKAWTSYTHLLDGERPVGTNVYGYDYITYDSLVTDFDYLVSQNYYGGKKDFWTDVSGMDIYPIDKARHPTLAGSFIMQRYLAAIDSMISKNRGLIPYTSFIEMIDIDDPTTRKPTCKEINMEAWMNIIHDVKGIDWFQLFGNLDDTVIAQAVTTYQTITKNQVFLATPSKYKVMSNRTAVGGRVDAIIRDTTDKSKLRIFAIRVTEPDSISRDNVFKNANEPVNLTTTLTLDTNITGTVTVEGESRTVPITNGAITDVFAKNILHIYSIPLGAVTLPSVDTIKSCYPKIIRSDVLSSVAQRIITVKVKPNFAFACTDNTQIWLGSVSLGKSISKTDSTVTDTVPTSLSGGFYRIHLRDISHVPFSDTLLNAVRLLKSSIIITSPQ